MLEELLTNIARHGCPRPGDGSDATPLPRVAGCAAPCPLHTKHACVGPGRPGEMRVVARVLPAEPLALELVITDDGAPFDPLQAPLPERPSGLEEATMGGRGLLLVRRMASQLEYHREQARNVVRILIEDRATS